MVTEISRPRAPYRHQIQQIATNLSEGVILIDVDQTIRWANEAALAMHGVDRVEALGRTIDEYHANFQVKFRSYQSVTAQSSLDSVAAGETYRDVVIEVTPLNGDAPKWVHRIRNLVLTDEAGNPSCVALVLHAVREEFQIRGQFASSVESVPQPAAILRLRDQIIVGANQSFLDLTELDRPKVIARALSEIGFLAGAGAPGDVHSEVLEAITHATPLGLTQSSLRLPNGGLRPVLLAGQPIDFDAQRCMLFTFVDLSPAATASVAARHSQHDPHVAAQALCAAAPAPIHVLDGDMRILGVSEPWLEWLGHAGQSVIGRNILEFMSPASAAHFESHTWSTLTGGGVVRDAACQFVRETGDVVDTVVSLRADVDDAGRVVRAVAAPVDVTERKRNDGRFATLFGLSPLPMIIRRLDDSRIMDANDAFLTATGHTAQAVVGHLVDELGMFETRAQRQQFEQELRGNGRPRNVEARIRTVGGEILDCLLSAEIVHVFGQPCALLVLQDVTERRRNETQLFQAIEMVMKDTSWFSRSVIEKLAAVRSPSGSPTRMAAVGDLTRREREVLGLVSHGLSDSDIAEKLGLTRSTVRNHVATLYSKIGVHSRRNAIVWARERGINIAWPTAASANHARRPAPL
jgi:PAS domain S-box-containing protein